MKPIDDEKVKEEKCGMDLESGTSLAASEWERNVSLFEDMNPCGKEEEKKDNNDNSSSGGVANTKNVDFKGQVGTLRSLLANDVICGASDSEQHEHRYQTFTSPYETEPFSQKYLQLPLIYCDQTASNRPLGSVERYIQNVCLPLYGNTHTNTSVTGSQSTAFVAEARQIVAEAVNAKITGKAALDVVMFAGSGTTSAVQLLIDCLGISNANHHTNTQDDSSSRPVIFVGPYEHHSNLLPWRESGAEIVMVPENPITNTLDYQALEQLLKLEKYGYNPTSGKVTRVRMGTFTAASNVTGKVSNINRIASLLHKHSALAFFDYATGSPYMKIDMNPLPFTDQNGEAFSAAELASDAIFLSPHKMIGGINTPGILVLKKHLVSQVQAPSKSGGGTVFYVTHSHHRFLSNRIERYEGGTPNVVGIMRAGLSFLVKRKTEQKYQNIYRNITSTHNATDQPSNLLQYEYKTHDYVVNRLRQTSPNLIMLGFGQNDTMDAKENKLDTKKYDSHLPIFSFLIKCGHRFLHYNYVCAILNDLFGIQSRGGCQCSGPYSQNLLGLTTLCDGCEVPSQSNEQIEYALLHHKERAELLRPGYTRLSLPFKGLHDDEVEYVIKALEWVAKNGWSMMCLYRCNHRTGEWRHFSRQGKPLGRSERRWLSHYDIQYDSTKKTKGSNNNVDRSNLKSFLQKTFENADNQLDIARNDQRYVAQAMKMTDENNILGNNGESDDELDKLRWYIYPRECAKWLKEGAQTFPGTDENKILGAIRPRGYFETINDCDNDQRKLFTNQLNVCPLDNTLKEQNGESIPENKKRKRFISKHPPHQSASPIVVDSNVSRLDKNSLTAMVNSESTSKNGVTNSPVQNRNGLHYFRDGEHHSGEATLEDIQAGFDDGELSDMAQIFETEESGWIPIELFLSRKKAKVVEEVKSDDPKKNECMNCFESSECTLSSKARVTDKAVQSESEKMKKPSRDSSAWGQSSQNHIPVQALLPQKKDLKDNECMNGSSTTETNKISLSEEKTKISNKKKKNAGRTKPPAKMMRYITQAMIQWNMVEEGDRLLLGLSGGKDSLSLLHCLLEFQKKLPIKFTIEVCTIDPMTPSFDPSPLIPYVESLGLKYHYIRDDIVSRASTAGKDGQTVSSLCAFCARMKRGNLYTCARKNNCNKLVLAQHLDDCAESFLMSVFHNGFLRTMKANYEINAGDLSVIRPMIYCRESLMTDFVKAAKLPVINENCPACFEEPKERARIKKLLSREETLFPNLHDNIRRALIPLFHDDTTAIMRCYTEEAVAKSRKVATKKTKAMERKKEKSTKKDIETMQIDETKSAKSVTLQNSTENKSSISLLAEFSEHDLVKELARRKASKHKLSGSYQGQGGDDVDPTGQVCTLDGRNGTIPCRELME